MKSIYTIINLLTISIIGLTGYAQSTTIKGTVKDVKGKPIPSVSISIKDSYDGTTADSSGNFSFTTDDKGAKIVEATAINYKTYTSTVTLTGATLTINIVLKEQPNEYTAVTVTAGSFEASDKKRVTVLTSLDIVTTASANADVTSALKTLPGTQSVGESEGLFVRGGTATESKIFIDGTQVNNFFYATTPGIASRGRFNPFLFKGTQFSRGGYSALYGQALSSALILESIDLPDQSSANIGISVVGLSLGAQVLDKKKKYSYGATLNHTNLTAAFAIVPQTPDYFKMPKFYDGDMNFRIKTSKTGMLKYYGYFSNSNIGIRQQDIDSTTLKNAFVVSNNNMYHNLSFKEKLGQGWRINAGVSYSTNKDNIDNQIQDANNNKITITTPSYYLFKNFTVANKAQYIQSRVVLEKKLPGISALRFGLEQSNSKESTAFTLYNGFVARDTVNENLSAVFAETDLYVTNGLAAKIGTRVEHSNLLNKWNIVPRATLACKLTQLSQLSLVYGQFYQNPDRRQLPTTNPNLGFSKATHYLVEYQIVTPLKTLRAELFYKNYNALYKTTPNPVGRDVVSSTNGNGYAKGFEVFWRDKKTVKNLDYWVSYSYLDSKRDFNNYPTLLRPTFATAHTASLVTKKFVTQWKTGFNASYTFATGRPYYNIGLDAAGKYTIKDQGTTINYNSLSFSFNYLPNLGKKDSKAFTVLVLSVSNVLGNNQVFTYNYSTNGQRKEAVTPPARRFLFLGCFISLGIDRTQEAINGNL